MTAHADGNPLDQRGDLIAQMAGKLEFNDDGIGELRRSGDIG